MPLGSLQFSHLSACVLSLSQTFPAGESQIVLMNHLRPNWACLLGSSPSPSPTPAQASRGQSSHTLCAFCCASPLRGV